jgi:hypothetical protein
MLEKVRCVNVAGHIITERQPIFHAMMHELVLAEHGDELVFGEVPSSSRRIR